MIFSPRSFRFGVAAIALCAAYGAAAMAQAPPPASSPADSPSTSSAITGLQPALEQVGSAVANLRISRWKADADIRDMTQQDVGSIQRDLMATLPQLLEQAQSSGGSPLAPSFAVFRNIDALYDVLLRITGMATLAGSSAEADQLENARASLETARAQLGDALLKSIAGQDAQLAQLRTAVSHPKTAPKPAPTKIIVDDGPTSAKSHKAKPEPQQPQQ
jgi:hypothetical protein